MTLKDTLWVEARNFAHDVEKMKELNRKRIDSESIDAVFAKIYDTLTNIHAELKSKNRPDLEE